MYLALKKLAKELVIKQGLPEHQEIAQDKAFAWNESKVKTLRQNEELPETVRIALKNLYDDDHVILCVKYCKLLIIPQAELEEIATSSASLWNRFVTTCAPLCPDRCVVRGSDHASRAMTPSFVPVSPSSPRELPSSSANVGNGSRFPVVYSGADDLKALVVTTTEGLIVRLHVAGHSQTSMAQVDDDGAMLLNVQKEDDLTGGCLKITIPPFQKQAQENLRGQDFQGPGGGSGGFSEAALEFDGTVANEILGEHTPSNRDMQLTAFLDAKKIVRSSVSFSSQGHVIAQHDRFFGFRPADGSALVRINLRGHDVERGYGGAVLFTPEVKDGVLVLTMKLRTSVGGQAVGGFTGASAATSKWAAKVRS